LISIISFRIVHNKFTPHELNICAETGTGNSTEEKKQTNIGKSRNLLLLSKSSAMMKRNKGYK